MLSKKDYYQMNAFNFTELSAAQKKQRYEDYKNKYLKKLQNEKNANNKLINNQQMVKNTRPLRTNNNGNAKNTMVGQVIRQVNRQRDNTPAFKFSKCLISYAKAAIDPFDNITDLPCIPDTITIPSYKYRTLIEADMTIGTQGVGWAVFNPWTMAINDTAAGAGPPSFSDYPLVTTTGTYASASYIWSITNIVALTVRPYFSNSPFSGAQYHNGATDIGGYRLVAAGLELQYTGVLLNQAGLVTVIQWDALQSIPQNSGIGAIRQNNRSQVCPTSRESRCYVRYEPTNMGNYDYRGLSTYFADPTYTGTRVDQYYYPMGIFVSGAEPGTTFRVKAVAYFESQVPNFASTPSESDAVGFPALQSARSSVLPTTDAGSDFITILKKTVGNIANSVSGFAPAIGTAIGGAFGQPALGGTIGSLSKDLIQAMF